MSAVYAGESQTALLLSDVCDSFISYVNIYITLQTKHAHARTMQTHIPAGAEQYQLLLVWISAGSIHIVERICGTQAIAPLITIRLSFALLKGLAQSCTVMVDMPSACLLVKVGHMVQEDLYTVERNDSVTRVCIYHN